MDSTKQSLMKIIVIVGPTASGKTSWALRLAKEIDGEIISADSRQIYTKMDIGTAKEKGEWVRHGLHRTYYIDAIAHYLVDFLDPGKPFTMADFKEQAIKSIGIVHKKNKMPIVIGGTGLYIHALVDNLQIPKIVPNKKLRNSLEEKSNEELLVWLKNLDPVTAETVDVNNKRRLIRALEVCILSGTPFSEQQQKGEPLFEILQIGIDAEREVLYKRINERVEKMFDLGLVKEVEALLKQKYSWELPSMSGIGYRQFKDYFEKKATLEEVKENLKQDTRRYAKRQWTWFKRDPRIKWCKTYEEADNLIKNFLCQDQSI